MIVSRRRRGPSVSVFSLVISLLVTLYGSVGDASAGPNLICGCGGCLQCGGGGGGNGPGHVWVTLDLFSQVPQGAHGVSIRLNGTNYVDGDAAELEAGVSVSISMTGLSNVTGDFTFDDWESDVGNFSNNSASSTTFTPFNDNGAVGDVAGVVHDVHSTYSYWAGYVIDETDTDTTISCVGGTVYIEPYSYAGGGYPTEDEASAWVGIGGYGSALFQAGVEVNWTGLVGGGGNQLLWSPFVQAWNSTSTLSWSWWGPQQHPGAYYPTFTVSVCNSGGSATVSIEAYYVTNLTTGAGYGNWWNETGPTWFQAYQYQADWIVEDSLQGSSRAPLESYSGYQIKWSSPSWKLASGGHVNTLLLGPLDALSIDDTAYGTQLLAPNQIAHVTLNNFLYTYST